MFSRHKITNTRSSGGILAALGIADNPIYLKYNSKAMARSFSFTSVVELLADDTCPSKSMLKLVVGNCREE